MTCRSERCEATPWCCSGNLPCTRAAIPSMGSTSTSRKRRPQRKPGGESTPRLQRKLTSRSSAGVRFFKITESTRGGCCFISVLFSFSQIKNLKEGETYVFRVRAQNKAGVGNTSDVTEPVPALTKPGQTTERKYPLHENNVTPLQGLLSFVFQAPRRS